MRPDESVRVCSMRYADRLIGTGDYTALISIAGSDGVNHCQRRCEHNLLLNFDDATPYLRNRRSKLMTPEQMLELIGFVDETLHSHLDRVLVHCKAGRCRSPAVAVIVHYRLHGCVLDACNSIALAVPMACPNDWVLRLADAVLDHGGTTETLSYYSKCIFPRGVKW